MAQKTRAIHHQKSDLPVFDYLDLLMPRRLIESYRELPRHIRYTILSTIASLVLLWAVLTIVVGGINNHIATRGAFLYDALYTPYSLEARVLPVMPEAEAVLTVLPSVFAEHYHLQSPPTAAEIEAAAAAERAAFLGLAAPLQSSLTALQGFLNEMIAANAPTGASALLETLNQKHSAVNGALTELTALYSAVAERESLDPVILRLANLRNALAAVTATGIEMAELQALSSHLDTLAARPAAIVYRINDCLQSSSELSARPCPIATSPSFVERGDYLRGSTPFNVVVAEFASHEEATSAVSSLYHYGRSMGRTGNFSLDTIEYDYFFHYGDSLYSFSWSHEQWVYSISAPSFEELDAFLMLFPY